MRERSCVDVWMCEPTASRSRTKPEGAETKFQQLRKREMIRDTEPNKSAGRDDPAQMTHSNSENSPAVQQEVAGEHTLTSRRWSSPDSAVPNDMALLIFGRTPRFHYPGCWTRSRGPVGVTVQDVFHCVAYLPASCRPVVAGLWQISIYLLSRPLLPAYRHGI
jgi:hypothetical protein